MGAALHELFPFVDYVCSGEGDGVFRRLAKAVDQRHGRGGLRVGHVSPLASRSRAFSSCSRMMSRLPMRATPVM